MYLSARAIGQASTLYAQYVKIDPSQNQDLRTSLERPYKELLNALISFEICHS